MDINRPVLRVSVETGEVVSNVFKEVPMSIRQNVETRLILFSVESHTWSIVYRGESPQPLVGVRSRGPNRGSPVNLKSRVNTGNRPGDFVLDVLVFSVRRK